MEHHLGGTRKYFVYEKYTTAKKNGEFQIPAISKYRRDVMYLSVFRVILCINTAYLNSVMDIEGSCKSPAWKLLA